MKEKAYGSRLSEHFMVISSCFLDLVLGFALALLGEHLIGFFRIWVWLLRL